MLRTASKISTVDQHATPRVGEIRPSHKLDDYLATCHSVDRNDLEALDGLCLEWRVDLEPSICAQEAIKAMQVAAGFEQPPAIVPRSVGGDGLETRVSSSRTRQAR